MRSTLKDMMRNQQKLNTTFIPRIQMANVSKSIDFTQNSWNNKSSNKRNSNLF